MPLGAAASEASSGEAIVHFASIRFRINGTGEFRMSVYSLDDVIGKVLVPITMQPKTRINPTRIVNFMQQRAAFEFKTTSIDEKFRVNRIVVFARDVYTSFPGN